MREYRAHFKMNLPFHTLKRVTIKDFNVSWFPQLQLGFSVLGVVSKNNADNVPICKGL